MANDASTDRRDAAGDASTEVAKAGKEARPRARRESPGGLPLNGWGVAVVAVYLVLVAVVVVHGLVVLWPPSQGTARGSGGAPVAADGSPAAAAPAAGAAPRLLAATGGEHAPGASACQPGEQRSDYAWWSFCLFPEERLFIIVMLAGALGGLIHSLRSFAWYLGNRKLYLSWVGLYITLPVVGAAMAIAFYLVIRAGFTAPNAQFNQTNPFGFAAMAVLVGMFTEQAAVRLKQVSETIFAKAPVGSNHVGGPTLTEVEPASGPIEGQQAVVLTGTGFEPGAVVRFGGAVAASVEVKDDTTIEAVTPEADAAGVVTVEVTNPGGAKSTLPDGYTYAEAEPKPEPTLT